MLSREHFRIENQPPLCHLADLGSTNGTKVNGLRVERVLLRDGDVITAGDSSFVVQFAESFERRRVLRDLRGLRQANPDRGRGQPANSPNSDRPSDEGPILWLCPDCQARRLKFPKTIPTT